MLHKYLLVSELANLEGMVFVIAFILVRVLRLRERNHAADEEQSLGFNGRPSNPKACCNY